MKRKDKPKLENEEQGRNCKGNKLSGFRSREWHLRNGKNTTKLNDTPEKIRNPQKVHKININPNSIYIGNWIYKQTTRVNSSQEFKAGRRPFLSIELNF
jgi:tRNA G10  N-methylase Trm11